MAAAAPADSAAAAATPLDSGGPLFKVRDLWKRKDLGVFSTSHMLSFPSVGAHDCVMLRFDPA